MGYQKVVTDAKHIKELSKSDRFVKISVREDRCDLPSATWKTLVSNTDDGSDNWGDQAEYAKGRQKMSNLRDWLLDHEDEYLIDTYYQDMYGYNGSKNWNSILRKV